MYPSCKGYLENRVLKIVAIVSIVGNKLLKALIAVVFRLGAFAPQSLDTILFATGGADIALTRFGICNMLMIHT